MKFVFASDSFKASLTSHEIHTILTDVAKTVFPGCETVSIALGDGGEGTVDAIKETLGGTFFSPLVNGPLGSPVQGKILLLPNGEAVMEMASASGYALIKPEEKNPLKTSTFGTGELMLAAAQRGIKEIVIGIGGSATNDGGIGALSALGIRFLDKDGKVLAGTGENLIKIHSIDCSKLSALMQDVRIHVMCDVNNPLVGTDGATYTFGEQKGADRRMQDELEAGMRNYLEVSQKTFRERAKDFPGAGAAGGLGYALRVFLNASIRSGIETVLDLVDFDNKLFGANLVITGEGRIDWQSARGKVVSGVLSRTRCKGIPTVAIVGCKGQGADELLNAGLSSILTLAELAPTAEYSMSHASELYQTVAENYFKSLDKSKY